MTRSAGIGWSGMKMRAKLWGLAAIVAMAAVATPGVARAGQAAGDPASAAYAPKDLTGVWVTDESPFANTESFARAVRLMRPDLQDYPEVDPTQYPNRHPTLPILFTPEFQELHEYYKAEHEAGRPYRTGYMCQTNGLLAAITSRMTTEIYGLPGRLLFNRPLIGWVFTVHMDRPHKTEFVLPELFGDSVGHWEGDTLVVDTVNLGGHAVMIETEPHSQSLHVVQRISRPTYDTLVVDIVADDPRAFQQPVKFHTTYRLDNSVEFNEAQCWYDGGGAPMAHAPE